MTARPAVEPDLAGAEEGGVRVFACLDGFEPWVEAEVLRAAPGSLVIEARPGAIAVRDPSADAALAILPPIEPAFARSELTLWGEARGRSTDDLVAALEVRVAEVLEPSTSPPALHVFAASMQDREARTGEARRLEAALRRRLRGRVSQRIAAAPGDEVIDVAIVGPGVTWLGAHRRTSRMSAFPGGQRRLAQREEAPARSHLKLEEGLEWAALPLREGDVALDVGCAPGGWSYVLLEQGLVVHGIDPTPVAEPVRGNPRFTHHRESVKAFRPESVPAIRWVFCDMNGPPESALGLLERLVSRCPEARAVFYTLKLSDDPPLATLDRARARFRGMGFPDVVVRHLYHNRHELTLVARRRPAAEGRP